MAILHKNLEEEEREKLLIIKRKTIKTARPVSERWNGPRAMKKEKTEEVCCPSGS